MIRKKRRERSNSPSPTAKTVMPDLIRHLQSRKYGYLARPDPQSDSIDRPRIKCGVTILEVCGLQMGQCLNNSTTPACGHPSLKRRGAGFKLKVLWLNEVAGFLVLGP